MNIINIDYGMSDRTYSIFLSGCKSNPKCRGCFNPESWDFSKGEDWTLFTERIKEDVVTFNSLIDKIILVGGEPIDQDLSCLKSLIMFLRELNVPICLFTHYSFEQIPEMVKETCDYIKCGAYIPELTCNDNIQYNIKLATSNQKIYKKGVDY